MTFIELAANQIVLDPFAGSGTVGVVALRHGRRFLGCELNPKYVEMARLYVTGVELLLSTWDVPPRLILLENVPRIANRGRHLLDQIQSLLQTINTLNAQNVHLMEQLIELERQAAENEAAIREAAACTYSGDILRWRKTHAAAIQRARADQGRGRGKWGPWHPTPTHLHCASPAPPSCHCPPLTPSPPHPSPLTPFTPSCSSYVITILT